MKRIKEIIVYVRDSYIPYVVVLMLLALSILVQFKFFIPKYRTDWNKELTQERDSIIRELKKDGMFFNDKADE